MNKYIFILTVFLLSVNLYSNPISKDSAEQVAMNYFKNKLLLKQPNLALKSYFKSTKDSIITYYTFNFEGGGWAIISADDAATPILAYSQEGSIDENKINSSAKEWLEDYNNQILYAIKNNIRNTSAIEEWQNALNNNFKIYNKEVGPLLTCEWNQTQFYNDSCPADKGAPYGFNGHVPAGCVAIAMAQIMKYYSYPPKGIGSNSYYLPKYGQLSANFGNTTYNWDDMPDSLYSPNKYIAQLVYHCGVSVNMIYDSTGSGAGSPAFALIYNFGFSDSMESYFRENDSAGEELWIARLKIEIDAKRPIYYTGYSLKYGHAFVCDGYDNSFPTKFHFNWGWGGDCNGYFAIGALDPLNSDSDYFFNNYNYILTNIKPNGTSSLSFNIITPDNNQLFSADTIINVALNVLQGNPKIFYLYIDGNKVDSVSSAPYVFTIYSKHLVSGQHFLEVIGTDGKTSLSDSKYFIISSGFWQLQAVIPSTISESVHFISIADSNAVWATLWGKANLFAVTSNGGTTWDTGHITNPVCDSLNLSDICGISNQKAYACFNPQPKHGGAILYTADGGKNWTYQASADFSNSWANWVYFFDENNGVCMGDPYQNEFVIYTTNDGGMNWNRVPSSDVPSALNGETGTENNYDAYHNMIWFGTSRGRLFKSFDNGLHWSVSDSIFSSVNRYYIRFKDSAHIIGHIDGRSSNAIYRTNDAGKTWEKTYSNINCENLEFVPGTDSTWINYSGLTYASLDDGKSFFRIDNNTDVSSLKFYSQSKGWAGGYYSQTLGGAPIYNWIGSFSSMKMINVTFNIVDENDNPLSGIIIYMNNSFYTTDKSGRAIIKIGNIGKFVSYTLQSNSYETTYGNFMAENDTVISITMKSLSRVTFNVINLFNNPVEGISIFFNDSIKNTDFSGKVKFSNLSEGGTYIYSVLKGNEYIDYGTVSINEKDNFVTITFLTDSFYKSKQIPDIIFPNPASELFCIMSGKTINSMKLFSTSGEVLFEEKTNSNILQVPVKSLKNGLYLLQVIGGKSSNTYKLIVSHR